MFGCGLGLALERIESGPSIIFLDIPGNLIPYTSLILCSFSGSYCLAEGISVYSRLIEPYPLYNLSEDYIYFSNGLSFTEHDESEQDLDYSLRISSESSLS